jgi:hypothetical protein
MHSVSSVRKWDLCRRRYRYEYVDGVRPRPGKALRIGSAVHVGLEHFDAGKDIEEALALLLGSSALSDPSWQEPGGAVEFARVRAMLRAYWHQWGADRAGWEIVESEAEFTIDLADQLIGGRNDAVWRWRESRALYLVERKTTSDDVENVGTDYWQRMALDVQITTYQEAAWRRHGEMPAILYDVIKKPGGEPRMKKPVSRRKTETDEEFAARKEAERETISEFEQRLYDTMISEPGTYLVRREVHRTAEQNAAIIAELGEKLVEIGAYRGSYPRNDGACQAKYGLCPFLGVCVGQESLDADRFERRPVEGPSTKETGNEFIDSCPL